MIRSLAGERGLSQLVCAAALCMALAGCRSAAKEPVEIPDSGETHTALPLQVRLQFHVVGLREANAKGPFPAAGFRLAQEGIEPLERPDTIAGAVMSRDELSDWLRALQASGEAVLYMAPSFTVAPGLHAGASNSRQARYVSNWHFDAGVGQPEYATWTPGVAMDLRPMTLRDTSDLLIRAELRIAAGELESHRLAGPARPNREAKLPELVLQSPREAIQRLKAAARVPDGGAAILAHYVKQYRCAPDAIVREHLFYIASAARVGEETEQTRAAAAEAPPLYALSLSWNQWNGAVPSPAEDARAQQEPALTEAPVAAVRERLRAAAAGSDPVCCTLALAMAENAPAEFEVGERRTFVEGIEPDPSQRAGPYRLALRQMRAGMRLQAQAARRNDQVCGELTIELDDAPLVEKAQRRLPSIRHPSPADLAEDYSFHSCSGESAAARLDLPRPGQAVWRLDMPWRRSASGGRPVPLRERAAFLMFRELAGPERQAASP